MGYTLGSSHGSGPDRGALMFCCAATQRLGFMTDSHDNSFSASHYKWLEAERDSNPHPPMDRASSNRLQDQLISEIQALEVELSALQDGSREMDFSRQQTCREMIHSRQQMFLKLRQ